MESMNIINRIQTYFTDNFVFLNPDFDVQKIDINTKRVIFINKGNSNEEKYIPCLFIQEYEQRSKFLIFFHGNSEDIFISELLGQYLSEFLKMNVIIVEYPGYSIYNEKKSADLICEDSRIVYKFVEEKFNLEPNDIYVLGRSLGTGPATYLASKEKINSLFLISPFKSIKSVYGIFSKILLLDIFKSIEIIKGVSCPIKIIHGKKDNLIDPGHSKELMEVINSIHPNSIHELKINENMTHNEMDIEKDIFSEINSFIQENKLYTDYKKNHFSLKDKQYDNFFDIPVPVQNFLLKKNLELDKPVIIKKEKAKCSLLLNDGRIAFGLDDCKILIYDIDEDENQINIDTTELGQIKFLFQLKNNILVAGAEFNIGFYSLKRFKYNKIDSLSIGDLIVKMDKGDDIIFISTSKNLFVYKVCDNDSNKKLKIQNQFNYQDLKIEGEFKNFIFLERHICFSTSLKTYIFYNDTEQKKLKKIKEYSDNNLKISLTNFNIIKFKNNKNILFLNNEFCYSLNINDFSIDKFSHHIPSPSYFYKLNENSIVIGNTNNYKIFLIDVEKNSKSEINKKNLNISGEVTSFFALKNGRVVLTTSFNKEMNIENSGYMSRCKNQ